MITGLRRLFLATALMVASTGAGASYAAASPASDDSNLQEISQDGLHLVLNVAGNWLYVYENGERTRTYSVSVGLPGYETPAGEYRIRHINWNPWWHPPNSDWARGRTPEPPGSPDNPMGRVKIHFAPLLYIHGTPESEALGYPASRGCVRMRNDDAIELARLIHSYASPRVAESLLNQLVESPRMDRTIQLPQPVRFTTLYEVATIENGFLVIYPDIYGRMKKELRDIVEHTLEQSGVNMRRVNREHLERLLEKGATRRVVIAMDELVAGWRPAQAETPRR
jgi:hypothetical protein